MSLMIQEKDMTCLFPIIKFELSSKNLSIGKHVSATPSVTVSQSLETFLDQQY
jgi:hypothetical protein